MEESKERNKMKVKDIIRRKEKENNEGERKNDKECHMLENSRTFSRIAAGAV